jgi:multiple sugar transport system permease protein
MRRRVFFGLGIAILLIVVIFPLLWIFLTSFKSHADIYALGLVKLFTFAPTVENFERLFFTTTFFLEIRNTVIVAVTSTALVMAVSLPAGYSFARWNTGGGMPLFITISTRMFPPAVAGIAYFFTFKTLGLLDTHLGLTLLFLYFNMSFATFLLFGFFREIPREVEDAAMVDGYSRMEVFRKIIFPLIKPGAAVTAIFSLVWAWNEFFFASLFTRITTRVVSVSLPIWISAAKVDWGPMMAAVGLSLLPTLLAAWFMQRYIIRGLTFGAVKG